MSCQPRPQPQANGTAATSASSGTATKTPTRNRWPAPPGESRSGLLCRGVFGAMRISGAAAISHRPSCCSMSAARRDPGSNARQWLPYAYVTVTYADVSSARARRRFHLAVAFLTPEGHRFGLTIRDDAHLPHDCSVMQHRVAGGLDRVVERQFAFPGRL